MVSDDAVVRDSIKDVIESLSMGASMFGSLQMYHNTAQAQGCGCLVFDTHNVDLAEAGLRTALQTVCAATPVIVIADCGDVSTAVCGMQLGAVDIVQKPYRENRLVDSIHHATDSTTY